MTGYKVSSAARRDILDIVSYIAARDVDAATKVRDTLLAAFARLARRPALGHVRPDLTRLPVRFLNVIRRYNVAYRDHGGSVEIVRVFGPGRDIPALLR
ncbi:type II toxin-antitoxin system RelE/ParE family toxin [Caulobacter sp. BK020]|uniref:type II toxin-antitoxin system RelE/ParE family toxin n=1 Tax=Caulobacter sp. BK020 TaxID=2512117 RepID=UPI001043A963|nr:type II toxin-antitoxin system RelE/ParE family toxin [Caulobacter sp. BK020]TCS16513.1 plasmid stabilization system protein ParE [Caulobacter sp. BK020]